MAVPSGQVLIRSQNPDFPSELTAKTKKLGEPRRISVLKPRGRVYDIYDPPGPINRKGHPHWDPLSSRRFTMATKLKTAPTAAAVSVEAADFELRVKQIPDIFAGLSAELLLSQVPGMKEKAKAHKSQAEIGTFIGQVKGLSRSYRRLVAEAGNGERLEPSMVLPLLAKLEGVFGAAEAAGYSREMIVGKSDSLTKSIVGMMAVVGLLL
jgi:hypothetical protein